MGRGVDLLKLADGDMGVALGRRHARRGRASPGSKSAPSAPIIEHAAIAQVMAQQQTAAPGLAIPAAVVLVRRFPSATNSGLTGIT